MCIYCATGAVNVRSGFVTETGQVIADSDSAREDNKFVGVGAISPFCIRRQDPATPRINLAGERLIIRRAGDRISVVRFFHKAFLYGKRHGKSQLLCFFFLLLEGATEKICAIFPLVRSEASSRESLHRVIKLNVLSVIRSGSLGPSIAPFFYCIVLEVFA